MDDPNVVLRASTCYSLSIPFSNPCPFIFLLMLGNNSKDGKVMELEMDGERRLKWAGSIRNIKIRNRLLEDKEG